MRRCAMNFNNKIDTLGKEEANRHFLPFVFTARLRAFLIVSALVIASAVAGCVLSYDVDPSDLDVVVTLYKSPAGTSSSAKLLDGDEDAVVEETANEETSAPSSSSSEEDTSCDYLNFVLFEIDNTDYEAKVAFEEGQVFHLAGLPQIELTARFRVYAILPNEWPEYHFVFDNYEVDALEIRAVDCGAGHEPIVEVCVGDVCKEAETGAGGTTTGDEDEETVEPADNDFVDGGDTDILDTDEDLDTTETVDQDTTDNDPEADETIENDLVDQTDVSDGDPEALPCTPDTSVQAGDVQWDIDLTDLSNSHPTSNVSIVEATNEDVGEYIRLSLTPTEFSQTENAEIVLKATVSHDFNYVLRLRYIRSSDWGQVSLYIDDRPERILRTSSESGDWEYIDLYVPEGALGGRDVLLSDSAGYESVCLEAGEHLLRFRVTGKNAASNGYTVGLSNDSLDIELIPE